MVSEAAIIQYEEEEENDMTVGELYCNNLREYVDAYDINEKKIEKLYNCNFIFLGDVGDESSTGLLIDLMVDFQMRIVMDKYDILNPTNNSLAKILNLKNNRVYYVQKKDLKLASKLKL